MFTGTTQAYPTTPNDAPSRKSWCVLQRHQYLRYPSWTVRASFTVKPVSMQWDWFSSNSSMRRTLRSWRRSAFFSKTLNDTKINYSATERECCAVVWGVLTVRPYLEAIHFVVGPIMPLLVWMILMKDPTDRLMR